jgi:large subunit ribosomal protein L2
MPVVKLKPTSPGRRFVVKVVNPELHKGDPYAPLLEKKSKNGGRNNNGRITTRHKGGGHRQHYRVIDFKRNKDGVPGVVERLEYDPNRSANIALIKYIDGERRYIIAPKVFQQVPRSFLVPRPRSSRVTALSCSTSRSVAPYTALN